MPWLAYLTCEQPQNPEEDINFPENGVTVGCEAPKVGTGK